jgi:hypothetical protein
VWELRSFGRSSIPIRKARRRIQPVSSHEAGSASVHTAVESKSSDIVCREAILADPLMRELLQAATVASHTRLLSNSIDEVDCP